MADCTMFLVKSGLDECYQPKDIVNNILNFLKKDNDDELAVSPSSSL